jgi:hypothetical protein
LRQVSLGRDQYLNQWWGRACPLWSRSTVFRRLALQPLLVPQNPHPEERMSPRRGLMRVSKDEGQAMPSRREWL